MGIFLKGIFNIISDGGIIPKSPTEKIVEKAVQSLTKKAVKNITSNFSASENRNAAEYGDVIGVERRAYKHFGIY